MVNIRSVFTFASLALVATASASNDDVLGRNLQAVNFRQEILDAINAVREKEGLEAMCINDMLMDAAQSQANDMADNNFIKSTGTDGTQPKDRAEAMGFDAAVVTEVVGAGYRSAASIVAAWTKSASARSTLLSKYTVMGPGYSFDKTKKYVHFWAVDFSDGKCGNGTATATTSAAGSTSGSGSVGLPASSSGSGSAPAPAPVSGSGSAPAPVSGSGSAPAPVSGSGSAPAPASGSGSETPASASGSETPAASGSDAETPASGSAETPASGSAETPAASGSEEATPASGSAAETPASGSGAETPASGSGAATPAPAAASGSEAETPASGSAETEAPETEEPDTPNQ